MAPKTEKHCPNCAGSGQLNHSTGHKPLMLPCRMCRGRGRLPNREAK